MRKTVLITGATSGIGEACAQTFAENGYNLIITGRRKDRLERLSEELERQFGIQILSLSFDVRDREMVRKHLLELPEPFDNVDILLNNAGLAAGADPIQSGDHVNWERMMDTNVKGLLYVTEAILPGMKKNGSGHIINIASIAGKEVYPGGNVYCASKHAVDALTRGMRLDLVETGIKVSQVSPGLVETEFSIVRFEGDMEKAKQVYRGMEPLHASDVADSVYYIASRPAHVNIGDILILPSAQASSTVVKRNG
ncbi:MAG: SDR family oxidoreductase [Bacteroidota bacterium]|nr:SDR family oxidoreductase [Bacteroidota bacterium]MDX5427351.1 SDR family oxidoreductase [Bacteroidota bacterium]MDX5447159.1 SDR family oxidoreductase [Bacteroidota bacterium]MDX5505302.1 SDR family oxidoreductase [Bacteroidota bacterium]